MSEPTGPTEPIKTLPLVFDEPRGRRKPPRHLADLDAPGRKALVEGAGLPGFRAKQLSTHYFSHYTTDPAAMSDLPKAGREELVSAMFPPLLTEVKRLTTDSCTTSMDCPRDRRNVRKRAMTPGHTEIAQAVPAEP